jgi:hypothetical protein
MKHHTEYVVTVVTNLHDGRQARVAYPTENGINTWGYPCQTQRKAVRQLSQISAEVTAAVSMSLSFWPLTDATRAQIPRN